MTIITAKVIADSIGIDVPRITTLQLMYPRFIHSEFMTHRVFSRNASSSRAIPVAKMIQQVRDNPAMPLRFMKNKPGMQSTENLSDAEQATAKDIWLEAANMAAAKAEKMLMLDIHKQFVNRILEPFQYISVIVTATEWSNFFELRNHADAQPEIRELAIQMQKAMDESTPEELISGQWHLPYVTKDEKTSLDTTLLCKISAARCARVSYLTHDGESPDVKKDLDLYERLVGGQPLHASPIEHQAEYDPAGGLWPELHGNFFGWVQYRKLVELSL